MNNDEIRNEYFDWMYSLMAKKRYSPRVSYIKLFRYLHSTPFRYSLPMDVNRAEDGKNLRYRFSIFNGYEKISDTIKDMLSGPCSVLEMMVALAVRCEESIMDDPKYGDRTAHWFWNMIVSLGVGSQSDPFFDKEIVHDAIECFLDRDYQPNGRGGLFTVRHCDEDLRTLEIWHQLCRYLNEYA